MKHLLYSSKLACRATRKIMMMMMIMMIMMMMMTVMARRLRWRRRHGGTEMAHMIKEQSSSSWTMAITATVVGSIGDTKKKKNWQVEEG